MTLQERIHQLAVQHGSLRAAASSLGVDPGYLYRLKSGQKKVPGVKLLRRLGLRRIVTYELLQKATP